MALLRIDAPSALEYFAALVADDDQFSLLEAAISIAQDDVAVVDIQGTLSAVDALAARLKGRLAADTSALQKLRYLNRYFFHELGFAGNVNDYYTPDNSYLHRVLETRRGIPITLALIYMEIAQHIGLEARGVSFPGHFLIKVKMPQGEVVIDPFTGQSLSREDLEERLAPHRRRQGLEGDFEVPLGLFLQTATPRAIVARMLRNLKEIHRDAEDWARLLKVQQRLVMLLPEDWDERRDRGLVLAELGDNAAAADDLSVYLQHRGDAPDAHAMAEREAELRNASRPLLH